jgi:hypothetical protein
MKLARPQEFLSGHDQNNQWLGERPVKKLSGD